MTKKELQKQVGQNLQEVRAEKHMTREQLAEKAGISPTFYANLECGNKMMSLITLTKLAEGLGVCTDRLLFGQIQADRIKNIEMLLHDQPESVTRYVERLIAITLENIPSIIEEGSCHSNPKKEVSVNDELETIC